MSLWQWPAAFALALALSGAAPPVEADWQSDWQQTIAAAKQEGKVVVCQSPSLSRREFLLRQWKEDYPDIELSLQVVSGTAFVPEVVTERTAGKFLWDVFDSGPNSGLSAVKAGLFDPLLPELVLPEVNDPDIWGGWNDAFYDNEKKYFLGPVTDVVSPFYNAKAIAPEKAKRLGLKLLLDPEYKGKIVWYEPRIEGPGAPFLALIDRVLGADALRRFLTEQNPSFVGSINDVAQAVVRGKAVIGMGGKPRPILREYVNAGLKLDIRIIGNGPQTAYRTTDGTTVAVFNKRPHPNAARVFVNWMLTKRVSILMAKAQEYDSRRSDVPPLDPEAGAIPGGAYVDAQRDENDALIRQWQAELKKLRPQ